MWARVLVTVAVVLVGCAPVDGGGGEVSSVTVVRVVDGDTFTVAAEGGTTDDVRLIGVNAPEREECFAEDATEILAELLAEGTIRLEADTSDRDRHGRLLRYAFVDGIHVNAELVRRGGALARDHPPDTARSDELATAERQARSAGAGLWSECRSAVAASVRLTVDADAPGDDNVNQNGEWLDITNTGERELDLSGWIVRDGSASNRYVFAAGTVLPPGATLRLRTGCGDDGELERFWCHDHSAVWNNDSDTALLLDREGRTVATHRY